MALVGQEIKNLIGGISQQPDNLRFPEQCEEQINGFSSETDGLQKRPPSKFIKCMAAQGTYGSKPLVHFINRDATEQYYVVFTGNNIYTVDLAGNQRTVSGDKSYVTTSNPRDDLRCITIADYTFIINKKKVIQSGGGTTQAFDSDRHAIINVRGGQYGRTLKVCLNDVWTDDYTLPNGSAADDVKACDAQAIVAQLAIKLRAKFPSWAFNEGEGFIEIVAPSNATITMVSTRDGYNNDLIN
ncbi:phage nozzle protein [Raoultella ornithinolytica]|uniref:phage nozzle protein n=5 Tax=Klebsiella/Raoultella group TaxID=2890311 RepID=UPI0011AF59D1|nr:hypothetical protein [Raoultella ornithinolytica]